MKPLTSSTPSECGGSANELQTNATATKAAVDGRIEQERVRAAIGREMNETNEPVPDERRKGSETSGKDRLKGARRVIGPRSCEQVIQVRIVERRIDAKVDCVRLAGGGAQTSPPSPAALPS